MTDFLWTRPETPAKATILLVHGSGAAVDSPFLQRMTEALVEQGFAVARFEFAYMARRRVDGVRQPPSAVEKLVVEYRRAIRQLFAEPDLVHPVLIAGKSLGGRVAIMTAGEDIPEPVAGVACFGYPFHPSGDAEKLRLAPLSACKLPLFIAQGERDEFGNRDEVQSYDLPAGLNVLWLEDGSHDFGPRGSSPATLKGNIAAAAEAVAGFAATFAVAEPVAEV
jgi:uncharacterized protein